MFGDVCASAMYQCTLQINMYWMFYISLPNLHIRMCFKVRKDCIGLLYPVLASNWVVGRLAVYIEVAEQPPPFLASLCRCGPRIVNRGNYEGRRRMPVMGSSCPRVSTLGGTTAGAPFWDPIALWTLPSVTVVHHRIVTMVYPVAMFAP